jgi:hypothetical protein
MASQDELGALRSALAAGVPRTAIEVYARWWQLEAYLREFVYTELRCAHGVDWVKQLGGGTLVRAERDRVNSYMASADADEFLAYTDVTALFKLIEGHWDLFEPILLPQRRWQGITETLLAIRNRSAHCRRPHDDDLSRLEQALRDLEPGARCFYRSHADITYLHRETKDQLVRAWVGLRHAAAARLVEHCRQKYDVKFRLGYSVRPWAQAPQEEAAIGGSRGVLWNAMWVLGSEEVRPADLWQELSKKVRGLLVHLIFSGMTVTASFAALDDAADIADAIGDIFDRLVEVGRPMEVDEEPFSSEAWGERRSREAAGLPPKVQLDSALALFDLYNPEAFSLFSA